MKLRPGHSGFVSEFLTMVRYGIVGVMNTAVFSFFAWLFHGFGWHYALYTALAYAIAILFSFTMNRIFTFKKSGSPVSGMFVRFLTVTLSLLALVQLLQASLIELVGLPELFGVIAGMVFYTGTGYILNRIWVFGTINRTHGES